MSGEKRRGQWHSEAERIFDEVSGLTSLAQSEAFREQLDCIGDNNARSAIELLVWSWLRDGKTSFGVGSIELFSTNMILTATFALVFLIGWLELVFRV